VVEREPGDDQPQAGGETRHAGADADQHPPGAPAQPGDQGAGYREQATGGGHGEDHGEKASDRGRAVHLPAQAPVGGQRVGQPVRPGTIGQVDGEGREARHHRGEQPPRGGGHPAGFR
jgi:hypothetical protein